MPWFRWMILLCLLAVALGAFPAAAAPPTHLANLTAEITVLSGEKLTLKNMCVAERCAVCRDLAAAGACRDQRLTIKYMESDTFLPLDRVEAIEFHGRVAGSVNYYSATVTLWGGKKFPAKILAQKQVLPIIFCGVNDIGTISCLPLAKVKSLVIR